MVNSKKNPSPEEAVRKLKEAENQVIEDSNPSAVLSDENRSLSAGLDSTALEKNSENGLNEEEKETHSSTKEKTPNWRREDPHPENRFIARIRKDIQTDRATPESIQAKASQLDYYPPTISSHLPSGEWVPDYGKELEQEEIKLEGLYQQVEALKEKLRKRLELTKNLRNQNERIKKELKELGEEIVLVKKENETLIYQVKKKNLPSAEP